MNTDITLALCAYILDALACEHEPTSFWVRTPDDEPTTVWARNAFNAQGG